MTKAPALRSLYLCYVHIDYEINWLLKDKAHHAVSKQLMSPRLVKVICHYCQCAIIHRCFPVIHLEYVPGHFYLFDSWLISFGIMHLWLPPTKIGWTYINILHCVFSLLSIFPVYGIHLRHQKALYRLQNGIPKHLRDMLKCSMMFSLNYGNNCFRYVFHG